VAWRGAAQASRSLRARVTVAFAGLALLFLQLDAQFAGFAQILVTLAQSPSYVFAILLTHGSDLPKDGVFSRSWPLGLIIAAPSLPCSDGQCSPA